MPPLADNKKLAAVVWLSASIIEASNLVDLSPTFVHGILTVIGLITAVIGVSMWKDESQPLAIEIYGWVLESSLATAILLIGLWVSLTT